MPPNTETEQGEVLVSLMQVLIIKSLSFQFPPPLLPDHFDRTERGIITIHIGFYYLVPIKIIEARYISVSYSAAQVV